jgi:hypothetical protein
VRGPFRIAREGEQDTRKNKKNKQEEQEEEARTRRKNDDDRTDIESEPR